MVEQDYLRTSLNQTQARLQQVTLEKDELGRSYRDLNQSYTKLYSKFHETMRRLVCKNSCWVESI